MGTHSGMGPGRAVRARARFAYLYSDFCTGKIRAVVQSGGVLTSSCDLGLTIANRVAFGQNAVGQIYLVGRAGTIYRLAQG